VTENAQIMERRDFLFLKAKTLSYLLSTFSSMTLPIFAASIKYLLKITNGVKIDLRGVSTNFIT
jgi:hypothetical protein